MTVRLLVSVRSADEAVVAATGGADIIDIKEPRHGSLGRPSAATVTDIRDRLQQLAGPGKLPSISCALGELREWQRSAEPGVPDFSAAALEGFDFAKVGLAGCRALCDWSLRLQQLRQRFGTVRGWVAAAYADALRADAPEVEDVVAAAKGVCRVLLIDTWQKDGSTLLDWLSHDRLQRISDDCLTAGVLLALAGRVQLRHLESLLRVRPAIVAVRGAVCEGGDRAGLISASRIAEFRAALQQG